MNKKILILTALLMSPVAVFAVDKTMPMGDHHSMSPASQELMSGMKSMHNDMMAGVMSSDPDVAFAKGMIAHHQGAIQMSETQLKWHCCKVSDEAAFCLIQRPYISKTLLTRRISPRGSP